MSMSEATTWLVSQGEWGGQGWKASKRDCRKTGLRKGSGGLVLPQDSQDSGWQTLSTARGCSVYGQR